MTTRRVTGREDPDFWMTIQEVAAMFKFTVGQVYHFNQTDLPYHRLGKHCRYLYSEVTNWAMSKDVAIIDDPGLFKPLKFEDLPKTWPPPEDESED